MHGRSREDESNRSAEELKARSEKIQKYNMAKQQIMTMRSVRQYDSVSYALSGKLLELNPDFYSLFNYRKEIVQHMWTQNPASKSSLSTEELSLSFKALMKNPKSYGAWHHRLWVFEHGEADPIKEMELCNKMLSMDARNFNGWNYRRAVAARAHIPDEEEFAYTTSMINENFSNYSAWHYRTVLIPRMYNSAWFNAGGDAALQIQRKTEYDLFLDKEFELVQQAFYTEPNDQSAWLYHRWLLGRVIAVTVDFNFTLPILGISLGTHLYDQLNADSDASSKRVDDPSDTNAGSPSSSSSASSTISSACASSLDRPLHVFTRELASVDELLTVEENCKWALLTSAILIAGIVACERRLGQQQTHQTKSDSNSSAQLDRIRDIFTRLIQLDGKRRNYYIEVRNNFLSSAQLQ